MFNSNFYRQTKGIFSQNFYKTNKFYIDHASASYDKSDEDEITVTIRRNFLGAATIRLTVTGGKEAGEDYGLGKNFTGSGTWVNSGYEENYTVVSFGAAEASKEITITVVNNTVPEIDRVMTLNLANPSVGVTIGDTRTITIVDDSVDYEINVTSAASLTAVDASLAGYVFDKTGAADCRASHQAILDWIRTNATGSKVVFYYPNGTYSYFYKVAGGATCDIDMHLNDISWSMVGESFGGVTLKYVPLTSGDDYDAAYDGYSGMRRPWFSSYAEKYNKNTDEIVFSAYNIIFDGDKPDDLGDVHVTNPAEAGYFQGNWGPYFDGSYHYEHTPIFTINTETGTGLAIAKFDQCQFNNTSAAGIQGHRQVEIHAYEVDGDRNFRGLYVMGGSAHKLYVKNSVSDGIGFIAGGLDIEPDAAGVCTYVLEDFLVAGGKFQVGMRTGSESSITGTRITVESPKWKIINNTSFLGGNGTGVFTDCDFTFEPWGGNAGYMERKLFKDIAFTRCKFRGTNINAWPVRTHHGVDMFVVWQCEVASGDLQCNHVYTDCEFYALPDVAANHALIPRYGFSYNDWDDDATHDDIITLTNPVFDDSLNGGITYVDYGCSLMNVVNPLFSNDLLNAALDIDFFGSAASGWLNIGVSGGNLRKYRCYSNGDGSIIRITGTCPVADHNLTDMNTGVTYLPYSGYMHPTAMPRANPTVITYNSHGLVNGDKIMFDRMTQAGWAATSPTSNVPVYTVTKVNDNSFSIPLDSSEFAGDYDTNVDLGYFYKYPSMRVIQGAADSNPTTDKIGGVAGDRYLAGTVGYRCKSTGKTGGSPAWEAEA